MSKFDAVDGSRHRHREVLRWRCYAAAKVLLGDPDITVMEVARRVGVSPATLYRHLPGGRGALSEAAGT